MYNSGKKLCSLCRHFFEPGRLKTSHHGLICDECYKKRGLSRYSENGGE